MPVRLQLKYDHFASDPAAFTSAKAFKNIFKPGKIKKYKQANNPTHIFMVQLPRMQGDRKLCLTGNAESLGGFDPAKPVFFREKKNGKGVIKLALSGELFPVEYKLAVFDTKKRTIIEYEPGDNRLLAEADHEITAEISADFMLKYLWKGTGINVPLFSLRSQNSWGIGDLSDLQFLIRFAGKTGMKLVQLLPLNDTAATGTEKDSYPYSAISAFAIDPKYLDVEKILRNTGEEISFEDKAEITRLNALSVTDHVSVCKLKIRLLKEVFEKQYDHFLNDPEWHSFFEKSKEWLQPYAVFCFLRDKYHSADHTKWGSDSSYDPETAEKHFIPGTESRAQISFWYYVQFYLHRQLKEAVKFAHKKKIMLKADLPIGVGRHSADTWQHPGLFDMQMQAGAPPDAFSGSGQNWGFPTYDMQAMKADHYAWFKKRIAHLENYFDALRIDHVLGFFRIWSIPLGEESGLAGYFVPAIALTQNDLIQAGIAFNEKRFCEPFTHDPFDIILIKTNDGYHFRINMQQTASFTALNKEEKGKLNHLYNEYFSEKQAALWKKEGEEKLHMMKDASRMMLCAEDLGMVPAFTEEVLQDLNILSLQVQQMLKEDNKKFSETTKANYDCVVMPATHDMPPVRLWWEENRKDAQIFFNEGLEEEGQAPYFCEPWICSRIVEMHLASPAAWSIFLLQDILATNGHIRRPDPAEERINDPANKDHVWNYRMHISLEDLLADKNYVRSIKKMVIKSGR